LAPEESDGVLTDGLLGFEVNEDSGVAASAARRQQFARSQVEWGV
jgi:hypothetical protein